MNAEELLVKACIRDRIPPERFNNGHWLTNLALMNGIPEDVLLPMEGAMDEAHGEIALTHCDHCGESVYAMFDDLQLPWPYFGLQAVRKNAYTTSPMVQMLRLAFKGDAPLLNSFTRVHCKPSTFDLNVKRPEWTAILCNECFKQTRTRILYRGSLSDGIERLYAVSVMKQWGESEESVLKEIGLKVVERVGPGSLKDY